MTAPQPIFSTQQTQRKAFQEPSFNKNIYTKLPMFKDPVLYPEACPAQFAREAKMLSEYMVEAYGVKPYKRDKNGVVLFPLTERWLRGEEYGFLLRHYKTYCNLGYFKVFEREQDPLVYQRPRSKPIQFKPKILDGHLYYIKGFHMREFGFPRLREDGLSSSKKAFKWKKTNFVTDLPKHSPISAYIVAKTKNKDESFRMHVSILYQGKPPRTHRCRVPPRLQEPLRVAETQGEEAEAQG